MSDAIRLTIPDLVVLSVLLFDRPMHGHELFKLLQDRDVEDWASVSRPQVYYSLRKLSAAGYLRAVESDDPALGPERVVYAPASKAKSAMSTALSEGHWTTGRPPSPFVTWVALGLNAKRKTIDAQIKRRGQFLRQEIKREEQTLVALEALNGRDIGVGRALVSMAIKQFEAELASLPDLRSALLAKD